MFMIRRQLASLLTRAPGLNAYHPERECMPVEKIDRVSETASDWEATAVVDGKITKLSLEDFAGKFIVLVFYPFDFTYVADYKKTISKRYSVLSESMGAPLRGLIIIDNERKIRVVHINDAPIGRSVDETLRLLDAIKHVNEFGEVFNWKKGDPTIIPNPEKAKKYFSNISPKERVRELGVYCEMLPCTQKICDLNFTPKGIILSGSPYSVYDDDAPHEIAWNHDGSVASGIHREYGHVMLKIIKHQNHPFVDRLFDGLEDEEVQVWMSHGDQLDKIPNGFKVIGNTPTSKFAAIGHEEKHIFGIQFHPEVTHTPLGKNILKNFVVKICECKKNWTMESFIDKEINRIRQLVGEKGQVVGAVSGGVDSTVAAKLMKEAIDNGVMRLNECETVKKKFVDQFGINLKVVDSSELFLSKLKGVTDPEKKRKIIGNTFIEVFESEASKIDQETSNDTMGKIEYLLQGTLYPDVIESISFKGPSAVIKTHHNVGGLLKDMKLKLIEPLRELFKDEVRELGKLLTLDEELIWRHPFPGPGLAIRILGEVTPSQIDIVRLADHIYIEEIKKANLYRKISQAYACLLPVKAVGVMGDKRTYEQVIVLRAVETSDFMTADWYQFPYEILKRISNKIINEVKGVNRVVYDISSKPPATIECSELLEENDKGPPLLTEEADKDEVELTKKK
ncbi:80_t:CDS:10 [Entrophospora sp. SA101]|nr:80_t:CDS:10 [Entrophospora sp. SA101]